MNPSSTLSTRKVCMKQWPTMTDQGSRELENSRRPCGYLRDLETITGHYRGYVRVACCKIASLKTEWCEMKINRICCFNLGSLRYETINNFCLPSPHEWSTKGLFFPRTSAHQPSSSESVGRSVDQSVGISQRKWIIMQIQIHPVHGGSFFIISAGFTYDFSWILWKLV